MSKAEVIWRYAMRLNKMTMGQSDRNDGDRSNDDDTDSRGYGCRADREQAIKSCLL